MSTSEALSERKRLEARKQMCASATAASSLSGEPRAILSNRPATCGVRREGGAHAA